MAKGDIFKNEFTEIEDGFSGRTITRLTSPEHLSHHMYFYYRMVTGDGRYLIYASDRDGDRNLYRLDLRSGESVQLTEGSRTSDFDAILTSDDKSVVFRVGREFRRMDLANLGEEAFYEVPAGWQGGNPGISSDDRFLVVNEIEERDVVANRGGWSFFLPQWEARPHCRLSYVDIGRGTARIALDEPHCWLGHAQIRPGRNEQIMYCHEGPPGYIDSRIWLVNADGTGRRRVLEHSKDVTVGHEFFFCDGSRISAVYRRTTGDKKQLMYFIDPDTLDMELFLETPPFGHFLTDAACDLIVADCQSPSLWERTKTAATRAEVEAIRKAADPEELRSDALYIVDLKKREIRYLCCHGSSATAVHGNTQDAHPHPAFSPDGKFAVFSSDRDGRPCVYRVDIG